MSEALYDIGGLRFWSEDEILLRDQAVQTLAQGISKVLQGLNSAWTFHRVEGPLLTPRKYISAAYDDDDIFLMAAKLGDGEAALRAETTASSYLIAEKMMKSGQGRAPIGIYQVGKSFRRETNDGARASELRFNEFYQGEWQLVFKNDTKADIRGTVEPVVAQLIKQITFSQDVRMVDSDRLPSYSTQTRDVEVPYGTTEVRISGDGQTELQAKWKEMCSISTRTDFPIENMLVLEVAVGLDRLVEVAKKNLQG